MNTFCGLDLSLTCSGVSVLDDNDINNYSIKTNPKNFKGTLTRIDYISDEVLKYISKCNPKLIMIEDYFTGRNPKAVIQLCQLGTLVRYKLAKNKHKFITCAPNQLKKFCTGKGSGGKELILKGVYKKWDIDVENNNLADAVVLAFMARAIDQTVNNEANLLKYEEDVVNKILKMREFVESL